MYLTSVLFHFIKIIVKLKLQMVSPNATRHMYIISFQLDSMSLTMLSTTLSAPVPEKNDMNVDCANGGTQRQKNIVLK